MQKNGCINMKDEERQSIISINKSVMGCLANGTLHNDSDGLLKPKYRSLEEYCLVVANQLPQRQAFYTTDLADIIWKVQNWNKNLPEVEIFYAMKANPDPILLKLLVLLGLSFDCSTQGEMEMVLSAGACPQNIVFAHTIKPVEELRYASTMGVDMMTFDNKEELLKIKREFPDARLLLRLCSAEAKCFFNFTDKFGCSDDEASELLTLAKTLGMQVIGVSFHVGALCESPESYAVTIRNCRKLFDEARDIGFNFSVLDIGGGFFGQEGMEDHFHEVASVIKQAMKENFPEGGVRIIAEPGGYIAVSSSHLVNTVIGKKKLKNSKSEQQSRIYFLNDSIYGSFFPNNDQFRMQVKALLPVSRPVFNSKIFGQTCCCKDMIRANISLPELDVGDRVMWNNMGSYCKAHASSFCGVPLPEGRYVFAQNERLSLDWIKNKEAVKNLLRKHVVVIGSKNKDF